MGSLLPNHNSIINDDGSLVPSWGRTAGNMPKYGFQHHFIPHAQFRQRATLLSHPFLLVYSLLVLFIGSMFRFTSTFAPGVLGYASKISITELYDLTNRTREDAGLKPLVINEELSLAAHAKAEDMFKKGYWAHVAPDGKQPWDFILAQKYDYSYAGENLAKNFTTSRQVVDAWIASPSHKENLMNKNYRDIGYAVVNGVMDGYETTLVVQMFGKVRGSGDVLATADATNLLNKLDGQVNKDIRPGTAEEPVVENINNSPVYTNEPLIPYIPKDETPVVLSSVDITTASRVIYVMLACFVVLLLALDMWYSRRKGIAKFTGLTFAHITILMFVTMGIWFVLTPGRIL